MDTSSRIGPPKKSRGKVSKRSKIWEIFSIADDDQCKAICNECKCVVSRGGGTARSQCTTNLWNHLKNKHLQLFEKISKYKEETHRNSDKVSSPKSLVEYDRPDKSKVWELFTVDTNDLTIAKCIECDTEIKREEEMVTDTLWYHVMINHPSTYSRCVSEAIENVVLSSKGKRSTVWSEFTQHPLNICKVICNSCDTIVSRGTSKDRLNTTNMRRHLNGSHHQNAIQSKAFSQNLKPGESQPSKSGVLANAINEAMSECAKQFVQGHNPESHSLSNHSDQQDYELSKNTTNENEEASISRVISFPSIGDADTIMKKRQVDMVHTALLMNALYEQQKIGVCCDFSLFVSPKVPDFLQKNRKANSNEKSPNQNSFSNTDYTAVFKLHSCVAATISDKLRTAVEAGSDRITLMEVSRRAVPAFIQIVYTGKLTEINDLNIEELMEINNLASLLSAPSVSEYLQRAHPKHTFTIGEHTLKETSHNQKQCIAPPSSNIGECYTPEDMRNSIVPVSPQGIKIHETEYLVGYSSIPKVNKRKNYLPIANENSRKKSRNTRINDATEKVMIKSEISSDKSPDINNMPNSLIFSNPGTSSSEFDEFNNTQSPQSISFSSTDVCNDNINIEMQNLSQSPTTSSPTNCQLNNIIEHLAQSAEASQHSVS